MRHKLICTLLGILFSIDTFSQDSVENNKKYFGFVAVNSVTNTFGGGSNPSDEHGWYFDIIGLSPSVDKNSVYSFSRYTAEQVFNDPRVEDVTTQTIIDVGRTFWLNDYVVPFLAIGYGSKHRYYGYQDELGILGKNGRYYLEIESSSSINFQGGVIIYPATIRKPFLIFGSYNTFLSLASLGVGWAF